MVAQTMKGTRAVTFGRFIILGILVAGLGLSACGRKGPLEPPPGDVADAPDHAPEKPEPEEKKSFLLDFLIQ